MFKLNDNVSINRIIKNHNISDIPASRFKQAYINSTNNTLDFFLIDFKTFQPNEKFRHNFLNFLKLKINFYIKFDTVLFHFLKYLI